MASERLRRISPDSEGIRINSGAGASAGGSGTPLIEHMKHDTSSPHGELRRLAEERMKGRRAKDGEGRTASETARLVHELQVHQIELEMQNEELLSARAEIEASQARYFELYDLAPVGYVTVCEMGLILETNLTAATLLGVNRAAMVRQPLTRFILKADQDIYSLLRKRLSEIPSAGAGRASEPQTCELRMVKPGDAVCWVRMDATATDGPEGSPACRVVLSDITQTKQAESNLRHRLEYEQLLHDASTLALVADDVAEFHDRCLALIGERVGVDRAYVFRHDEATDTMDNTHEWCARGIAPQKDELQDIPGSVVPWWLQSMRRNEIVCYPNIEEIPDDATKRILRSQDVKSILVVPLFVYGQYHGFLGFDDCVRCRDWRQEDIDIVLSLSRIMAMVSEHRQAEEALRESERQYRNLSNAGTTLIWTSGTDKRCTFFNDIWLTFTGRTVEQEMGNGWAEGVHPDDFDRCLETYGAAFDKREPFELEYRLRNAGGEYRVLLDLGTPNFNNKGEFVGYIGHCFDITERKQAEVEKRMLEEQLRQAQKMESVGRLAGGVAHDFNNLLMGIMGYADLCLEEIEPGHPVREYLDEIITGANRSAEITRQLLAFARKQVIAPKILNLNDAVTGMLNLLRRMIGEDIRLIWKPGANLRPVKLDPSQVNQFLTNLCINARDAIAGVGEITVETGSIMIEAAYCIRHPEVVPGPYVFLAVSDDGRGMDQETLAQVFEPFFSTKGLGKGTGLGLATVYGIVRQNNGFVYAYSEPDKGATFKVYLPASGAESMEEPVTSKAVAPRGRGETILLAEDEKSLCVTCSLFLKSLGYVVLAAQTPSEALKLVDQHPGEIPLLLTDVVMPEMDGRQLAQRVSALKPGIKVVFMSGYTADVIAQRGVLEEGVQFLSKPFTRDDLAHTIRKVLEEQRPASAGR